MIDKLEYLMTLARQKHFGRAAEACGITQPTLSAGLKQLETELGVVLVHRGSRFQGLTPEGERVLEWARRIVGDARLMVQEVNVLKRGLAGHLRIAVIPTALPVASALIRPLRETNPNIRYSVFSRPAGEIQRMIDALEADAGISYTADDSLRRVRAIPLYDERYCLLIRKENALAGRETVGWADLSPLEMCLLTEDMQNRRLIDRHLREAGAAPKVTLESNSLIVLMSHVQTGLWSSVVPAAFARLIPLPENVTAVPIEACAQMHQIGLLVPERQPLSALTAALADVARTLNKRIRAQMA